MKISAKQIGEQLGITSREVNKLLQELGYLSGKPGNWNPTSIAKDFFEIRQKTNGYGGYAQRNWSFLMWDDKIINELRKFINK